MLRVWIGWLTLLQIVYYYVVTELYKVYDNRRVYLLSLLSSTVLSVFGLCYVMLDLTSYTILLNSMLAFFQASLIADMLVSSIEYPDYFWRMDVLYHHPIYMLVNILALYREEEKVIYLYYFLLEIPTLVKAIGKVFPAWRSDLLFGLLMISLRVVYHCILLVTYMRWNTWVLSILSSVALGVHVYWTIGWIKKYGLKLE